ncbi:MAG: c-type cytochrome [Pseudomonadales bacterium]|nr:c-type cytochrome [Pseudomonadales bacterium]
MKDYKRVPMLLGLSVLLHAGVAEAQAPATKYTAVPDMFIYCTTCHGVELRGNSSVDAPRLNGMEDWYVRNQMRAFAGGWRGSHSADLTGMEMQPQAAALTEKQREAAVQFVAAVPVRLSTLSFTVKGDADRGADLYRTCSACHGAGGEGNAAL